MMLHSEKSTDDTRTSKPVFTLLDFAAVIIKRWRLTACVTLAAAIVAVIYTLLLPNLYTARSMILPLEDDHEGVGAALGQLAGLAGVGRIGLGNPSKADVYMTMLNGETIRDPLIDRFRLMEAYEAKYRTDAYGALDKHVAITAGKKDGVITIAVDDKNPRRAAEMANAYVEELGRLAVRLNMASAGNDRMYLEKRLASARADLAKAEDALKAFQSKNKAVSVSDQAKATIEGVAQLRAQLAAQEVQLSAYRSQFTDSSQEVRTSKAAIGRLQAQIARLEGNGGGGSAIPSVGSMPQLGQQYLRLMRDFKIQETMVELLTKQYEVAKMSEVKDVSPFQVLQVAKVPEKKSKPHRTLIVLVAALTAFLCSVYLSFVLEHIDRMSEQDKIRWFELKGRLLFWKKQKLSLQNE
ncbi:lipopolysaccharide biosynthesis protein [Geobacter hydrogenophilus]|uniref:Polysaccharide chain length determinant protein n=2 Tax=Geobacter hydrogenophilus TaxID=40983 RepID=A0A9W6G2V0_9BACT|nr:lipopolysaccharide biosynthesis protein [Geobacter hydrogenophilus]GLI39400.1 polysaccharide chain length determinant protein [Geobacter hydrogenophilus]